MMTFLKTFTAVMTAICFAFNPQIILALPENGTVVGGSAAPFNYSGDTLTITQNSDRLVTDWESFSIGRPETVTFNQPGSSSIALNRITGGNPSRILGTLSANGRIFLVNPNGVLFGANAVVDTAGLLASTLSLDMSVADFISGNNNFTFSGPGGSIVNYGTISLNQPGGYVALLGSSVKNVGLIKANLGKVMLAAGEQITLDLDPAGLISVAVKIDKGTNRNDDNQYAAVNNAGTIQADGGKVILTADILDNAFTNAVNNDGIIEANDLEESSGQVLLKSNQNIELNGTITANGAIDAYAQDNIIIGKSVDDLTLSDFEWEYLSGDRGYLFKEFGYYYGDGDVHVVLSRGNDIGKDSHSPSSGAGTIELPDDPLGLYTIFDTTLIDNKGLLAYYQDPAINPDGKLHVKIAGTVYAWEDMFNGGDMDYNDAVIDFREQIVKVKAPSALLSSPHIFLTADQGSISQLSGDIVGENLMLSSNTGVSGTGSNTGLAARVHHLSAINKTSGHIRFENEGTLIISDLSAQTGLNTGVTGFDGVTNNSVGGEINIAVNSTEKGEGEDADLNVEAPVDSFGPVFFSAQSNIIHTALGDVTIHNIYNAPEPPTNLLSPSHIVNVPSLDHTIDITWGLPDSDPGYGLTADAGGAYAMGIGSEIQSHGGNVNITAKEDVSLALIDARNGNVAVTSQEGSVLDSDLGTAPGDYDVIAHNILLSAPLGTVGKSGPQEEIDLGYPYEFSYLWNNTDLSHPDASVDPYSASFNTSSGDWIFAAVSDTLADGSWWFHAKTIDSNGEGPVLSPTAHAGPYVLYSKNPPPVPPPIPPPPPSPSNRWGDVEPELRVYYEILNPSQFLAFEPITKIGLYAYHPLTPTDLSAFDGIKLDVGAYDFIDGNIKTKKPLNPYFEL